MKITLLTLLALTLLSTTMITTNLSASQKPGKPFLIQGKLPHLSGMVKILWDDEDLALKSEQKSKLIKIRKNTMKNAKALGKQINSLETKIVQASNDGSKPKLLEEKVNKLASLRAEATMVHLNCIYDTRAVLTKDQLYILE